jgi:hypothetical protein
MPDLASPGSAAYRERVSTVHVYIAARAEELSEAQVAFVAALRDNGVTLIWSLISQKVHTDTAPLLMTSNGLLCFEDVSTYHSAETSFALGDASWEDDGRPLRDRPLPVFAYTDGGEALRSWIWSDERVMKLPTDPAAAAKQLVVALA